MKTKHSKESLSLRHARKIMSFKKQYQYGKCNSSVLITLSLITFLLNLAIGIITKHNYLKIMWFTSAGLQLVIFAKHFMIKGFIELIDQEYEKKIEPVN